MKDKRRYPAILYILICAFLLAVQAVDVISIHTFSPDFILILTIIFSFFLGCFRGQIVAFILGLLLDSMSGGIFGLNAFVMVTVAACSWGFLRAVKMPSIIVYVLYLMVATVAKYFLFFLFYILMDRINLADFGYLVQIPGEIILNLSAGILIYILFARIDNRENYEWF